MCAAGFAAAGALGGCGLILGGIDDGMLADGGPDATADRVRPDAKTDGRRDAFEADVFEGGPPVDVVTEGNAECGAGVDASAGVFVSQTTGSDTAACDPKHPCKTVAHGLAVAAKQKASVVYVASGGYGEAVTLQDGIDLSGGWALDFLPICPDKDPAGAVVIQAPPSQTATVTGTGLTRSVRIATLTLESKGSAQPGESLYGVFLSGCASPIELDGVVIRVAAGGDGRAGATGTDGMNGDDAGCPDDSGAPGAPSGPAGRAAEAGTFSASGYTAGSGSNGSPGNDGFSGAVLVARSCQDCVTCQGFLKGCAAVDAGRNCGTQGAAGCGGLGGGPGKGGTGGGSSIGVFAWAAPVEVDGGSITVGNGGSGGPGGGGGKGGKGAPGNNGFGMGSCDISCSAGLTACNPPGTGSWGPGQSGKGGSGSPGSPGGGGAGGDSYGTYAGTGALITVSASTTITIGDAGAGAEGGGSGVAKKAGP